MYEKYQKYQWFIEITKLEEGKSFGELALINDRPRAATIMGLTDCHLATLDKQDYLRVFKKIENKIIL